MSVKCDRCGSEKNVRRAYLTLWNGNILDLCTLCYQPLVNILDPIFFAKAKREQDDSTGLS